MKRFVLLTASLATLFLAACGGSSGSGGAAPVGGAPGLLSQPVQWIDLNANGTPDAGDQLRLFFDRSVEMGANPPTVDLLVANGSLGTSTWTNGPGSAMTIELVGAVDLSMMGKAGAAMTLQLAAANTLSNPVDASTPATAAAAPLTLTASLVDSGQTLGSATAFAVLLQNVNSNIAPDLVVAVSGTNRAYLNDGAGVFSLGQAWQGEPVGGRDTRGVTLLDENGDGKADYCVTGNAGAGLAPGDRSNLVYVIGAGADPTFTHTPSMPNPGWSALGDEVTLGIGSGDFDGDGNLDVVCANQGAPNVIYFGDGAGLFNGNDQAPQIPGILAPRFFGGVADSTCVAVGDIDGVAGQDFVTGGLDDGGTFTAWRVNNSGTTISLTILTGLGQVQSVALSDLDNDGDQDAVVGLGAAGGFRTLLNNGSGVFSLSGPAFGTNNVFGVTCCDLNGDLFADVVAAGANGQPNKVWLNCGVVPFVFEDAGINLGTESTLGIASTDPTLYPTGVDNTGFSDIAIVNGGGPIRIYLSGK
jgi:hypothetical protein